MQIYDNNKIIDIMEKITVRVTVIKGEDLVAKDRNMLGQRTTSDPYIQCFSAHKNIGKGDKMFGKQIGQTETKFKTLNPEYNHTFPDIEFAYALSPQVHLRIYDYDQFSEDDLMGIVKIPIIVLSPEEAEAAGVPNNNYYESTQWYDVPKDSAKNAKGRLLVTIQTRVHESTQYVTNKNRKKQDKTSSGKKIPERLIHENGIVKLNPKYVQWKAKHGNKK